MLHQKILTGEVPYRVSLGKKTTFEEHRHADVEMHYCLYGGYYFLVNKKEYYTKKGDLIFVPPMVSHGIPRDTEEEHQSLTIIVGTSFLKQNFNRFSQAVFPSPVMNLNEGEEFRLLRETLEETAELLESPVANGDLLLAGNVYKICGHVLNLAHEAETPDGASKDLRTVTSIEKALELIYLKYTEPITVEDAAAAVGYGKSNFCKIFKQVVGETFHNVLNRQRIEASLGFLRETAMSVAEIAQEVGFSDAKTYCRVFKAQTGITPGTYRKNATTKPFEAKSPRTA